MIQLKLGSPARLLFSMWLSAHQHINLREADEVAVDVMTTPL